MTSYLASINPMTKVWNRNEDIITLNVGNTKMSVHIIQPFEYVHDYYTEIPTNLPNDVVDELYKFIHLSEWIEMFVPIKCSIQPGSHHNRGWNCCGYYAPILYYCNYALFDMNDAIDSSKVDMYITPPQNLTSSSSSVMLKRTSSSSRRRRSSRRSTSSIGKRSISGSPAKGTLKKSKQNSSSKSKSKSSSSSNKTPTFRIDVKPESLSSIEKYLGGHRFSRPKQEPHEVINNARLFYKGLNGYDDHNMQSPYSWNSQCSIWHNFNWIENKRRQNLKVGSSYLFNIASRIDLNVDKECETFHHMFVKRINPMYVIIADTWCWTESRTSHYRDHNIRAMKYSDFKEILKIVNSTDNLHLTNEILCRFFFIPFGSKKTPPFNELVYIVPLNNNTTKILVDKIINEQSVVDDLRNKG